MKVHVANLSNKVTEEQLQQYFARYGEVSEVNISWSHSLGRVVGAAVVDMPFANGLVAARELNGKPFRGRALYITVMADTMSAHR
jgi:RNA recognition motif-containing protein